MTEKEAVEKVNEIINEQELYIILSKTQANMITGDSVPFIGCFEGKNIIYIYDSLEDARAFSIKNNNGDDYAKYFVGKLDDKLPGLSLEDIIKIARELGATHMDYNAMTDRAFGVELGWFLEKTNKNNGIISMLLSKKKAEDVMNEGNIQVKFNPMKMYDYIDPFKIDDVRCDEVLGMVFDGGETVGDYKNTYAALSMMECLLMLDYVTTKFIPSAKAQNKTQEVEYFELVEIILQEVVWKKLATEEKIYTALTPNTEDVYVRNESVYVFITDLYEHMGKLKYKKLNGVSDISDIMNKTHANKLIVTDGPRYIGIIPLENIVNFMVMG